MTGYIKTKPKSDEGKNYDNTYCDCGLHNGVGNAPHEKRARIYSWYREYYPTHTNYDLEARAWLVNYEKYHGHQEPNSHPKFISDGHGGFVKNPKRNPMPVFI